VGRHLIIAAASGKRAAAYSMRCQVGLTPRVLSTMELLIMSTALSAHTAPWWADARTRPVQNHGDVPGLHESATFGRGINEHGGYFGVSARDCKIRGSKSAAGNPMATPGALLDAPDLASLIPMPTVPL